MAKLELRYPINNFPFVLNQAWGILNASYNQFGFTRHNGIDMPIPFDKAVWCPVRVRVHAIGYNPTGSGNYVQCITMNKWEVGGVSCYVLFVFMHNQEVLVKVGDILDVGDQLSIPDNTGFSTGPHIHAGFYRLNDDFTFMDKNDANGSFDPMPYFTGDYARINGLLQKVVQFMKKLLEKWQQQKKSLGI